MLADCGEDVDSAIGEFFLTVFGHVIVCGCTAFSVHLREIGSIGVESKNHVAGDVADGGVCMCYQIVKELMAGP